MPTENEGVSCAMLMSLFRDMTARCDRLEAVVREQQVTINELQSTVSAHAITIQELTKSVQGSNKIPTGDSVGVDGGQSVESDVDDVLGIPFLAAMDHSVMRNMGEIHVSTPVKVPGGETVSSSGVMATVTRKGQLVWTNSTNHSIHVLDMWTGEQSIVGCLKTSALVCSLDDTIVVGEWKGNKLFVGDISDLVSHQSLEEFESHTVPTIGHQAGRMDAAGSLKWILYRGIDWLVVRVSLVTFECETLDSYGEIVRLCSLCGYNRQDVFAVVESEGCAECIIEGKKHKLCDLSRPMSWGYVFAGDTTTCGREEDKTSSVEDIVSNIMVVDTEGNATLNGKQFTFTPKPSPTQGVVRLANNIILILDAKTWQWVAVKIEK